MKTNRTVIQKYMHASSTEFVGVKIPGTFTFIMRNRFAFQAPRRMRENQNI